MLGRDSSLVTKYRWYHSRILLLEYKTITPLNRQDEHITPPSWSISKVLQAIGGYLKHLSISAEPHQPVGRLALPSRSYLHIKVQTNESKYHGPRIFRGVGKSSHDILLPTPVGTQRASRGVYMKYVGFDIYIHSCKGTYILAIILRSRFW